MTRVEAVRLPASFGRYRVVSMIAEGGMGRVYRGIDPDTGAAVALKTVAGSRLLNLASLRREIHALRRLRHPGIVRIREQGIDGGVPWYAMDLVPGTPFRHFFTGDAVADVTRTAGPITRRRQEPLRGERLARVLQILQRLCAPLGFLHGQGIVHRDLKPENIVVSTSGAPVIIDFGLAAQFSGEVSREAISADAHAELGTAGYMAPEQSRGELHDARADIYAVGCMLYEAITGQPPIFASHRPPSSIASDVDPALDALAMRLLARDPRDRLGYMDDVESALAAIVGSKVGDTSTPPTYLYRPSFAGRDDALAQISGWLDTTRGGLALVRGESGVGKTRLVMEVARRLARQSVRIVTGECIPVGGAHADAIQASPLHPLRPLLRAIADHCRATGGDTVDRILGRRRGVLAAYEPELGELGPIAQPEPLPPQAARARLYADLGDTLEVFAREVPVVVVLDDLQWIDELTAMFLVTQVQRLRQIGIRVIGTYRSEAFDLSLEALAAIADVSIEIGRLGQPAVTAMVSDMLAIASPPTALVQFMQDHSEGNPFFVAEYLRAAVHEGWLKRDVTGKWQIAGIAEANHGLPLPRSLRELLTQRLNGMSAEAVRFIEAASVIGRDFESALVAEILKLDETTELQITGELLRRQVLEDAPTERMRFSHDKLREVAYEHLGGAARKQLHHRAADCLERARGGDAATFGVLAHHFLQAELDDRAADYLEKAGEHALRIAAHGQARQFFERALTLPLQVESLRRARWMRRVAESAFGQGDIEYSEARASETLAQLTGGLPSSRLGWLSLIATAVARQGLEWAVPRAKVARSHDERARCLEGALTAGQLASTYYFTGDALRMIATLLVGVNLADRAGSPSAVIESHARLAYIAGVGGLHRAANHYFARASNLAREEVGSSGRALTLYLHSFYHLGLAEWRDAEDKGRRALQLLVESGDRQDAEIATTIAAHAVYFSGRITEARVRYEQVLQSARARGNVQHEAWGLYLIGRSNLALGDYERATEELDQARRLLSRIADRFSTVMCHGLLAQAYLARRDLRAAEQIATVLHEQIAGEVVPLAPCVHGYVGAAEVFLALAEQDRGDTRKRSAARAASRDLTRFARSFPMARAAAHRLTATGDLLDGNVSRALSRLRTSADLARTCNMPYDEALAHAALAANETRQHRALEHREKSRRLFEELGAGYLLKRSK